MGWSFLRIWKKKYLLLYIKICIDYKKIAKTLKLSCSMVAKTIQWFNRTGSTQNKELVDQRSWVHVLSVISRGCVWEIDVWVLPALLQRLKGWGVGGGGQSVSAQTIRRTLHQIGRPRRKPLLKMMHKKARKQFAEDKQTKYMDYWKLVLWSDETKINLFGSDGVKRVWHQPGDEYKDKFVLPTVKHGGGSVMLWGCMSAAGTVELQFIEGTMNANMYCEILKQSMIPSLRRLGRRAVFQHDNDPKHLQDDHYLAKEAEGKGNLWGILKQKVEECKVSNIQQLRDVIMEEWKKTAVPTCEALMNFMPKRVKAVLENNGGPIWTFSLRGVLNFVANGLDINGCVLSYFEGTANVCCYTSCTLTTLHCSKVSCLQCCHMKSYNKILTKMCRVYLLLRTGLRSF